MQIKTNLLKVKNDTPEIFEGTVTDDNYKLVRLKLESQIHKIIEILRNYKQAGLIKSIHYPRNEKIQNKLDELVKSKRTAKSSLKSLKSVFGKF